MRRLILTTVAVAAVIGAVFADEQSIFRTVAPKGVYADYCVSFEEHDTTFEVKLLLVKEYMAPESIRLHTQASLKCDDGWINGSERYSFDVVEKKINKLSRRFTSSPLWGGGWFAGYIDGEITLGPTIQIGHISERTVLTVKGHDREKWKKGLSSLKKNTYTRVNVEVRRKCQPLDTTFYIDYRVRLIGECR
jgi:hypothetical protein